MNRIELIKGDITKLSVDVIVNAANISLLGGGGVDGAIHRAAGINLLAECKLLNGCKTGEAKITKGYNLQSSYIIHTVGPIWHGGKNNEDKLLASCYKNSLKLAVGKGLKTIAFSNISTGVYGFPKDRAAKLVLDVVKAFLQNNDSIIKVIFVFFDDENYEIYKNLL